MNQAMMTPEQITFAHYAYRTARIAAGIEPIDATQLDQGVKPTKTNFIIAACRLAKLAGLTIQRPRGPVDGEPFARSVYEFCEKNGVDVVTGVAIQAAPEPVATEDASAYIEEEELTPDPHRCNDAGGYSTHCLS